MPTYREYIVTWKIELSALSPKDAAELALKTQRDPDSLATVFEVQEASDESGQVDVIDVAE